MLQHRLFGKIEWALLVGGLSLLLFSLFIRSAWAVDRPRMQRDLGVMEEVLRSLCEHTSSGQPVWGSEPEVRGLYIEGYGALFLVEGCLSSAQKARVVVMSVQPEGSRQIVRTVEGSGDSTRADGETDGRIEQTRQLLAEFLGSYGSAIGQLPDDERITVLVRPKQSRHSFGIELPLPPMPPLPPVDIEVHVDQLADKLEDLAEQLSDTGVISDSLAHRIRIEINRKIAEKERESEKMEELVEKAERMREKYAEAEEWAAETEATEKARSSRFFRFAGDSTVVPSRLPPLPLLTATIGREDLTAHRRGKLTDAQFRERIVFQEYDPDAPHLKTIDIMAGILDKALDGGRQRGLRAKDSTTGIYQEGLGALFFVEMESHGIHFDAFTRYWRRDREEENPDFLERVENQLVETAADYGATLRPLKTGEYLVIEVRLPRVPRIRVVFDSDDSPEKPLPSRLVLKARKEDIDAYHRGDIDLEQFRKKVEIQEL